jgi:hypothetical protein
MLRGLLRGMLRGLLRGLLRGKSYSLPLPSYKPPRYRS